MESVDLNWLAVVVSTVAAMVIGALWYSPLLFARQWMAATGRTAEEMGGANIGYAVAAASWLIVSITIATVVDWAEADNLVDGITVGAFMWLAFVATTMAINTMFSGRSRNLYLIDVGYHLAAFVVIGAIHGLWN